MLCDSHSQCSETLLICTTSSIEVVEKSGDSINGVVNELVIHASFCVVSFAVVSAGEINSCS